MTAPLTIRPTYLQEASLHRLSVPRYLRMVEAGVLDDDDRVELLEGFLVQKMSRKPQHDSSLQKLQRALYRLLPPGWDLRQQSGVQLEDSVPEPDLAVVRGDPDDYAARPPPAEDVGLLVEVADMSLTRDTQDKTRICARTGIVCYWVIDLNHRQVLVYSQPSGPSDAPAYAQTQTYLPGQSLPLSLDDRIAGELPVSDLFPRE